MSIVRDNLLTRRGYTPYCGADRCALYWPRSHFNGAQFECPCGWQSSFEADFIAAYLAKWERTPPTSSEPDARAERVGERSVHADPIPPPEPAENGDKEGGGE